MKYVTAALSLCVTGFYVYGSFAHMINPGDNIGYTRMLMFACLATIPLAFIMVFVVGRWPLLIDLAKNLAKGGPSSVLLLIGLAVLIVLMPLGMLLALWSGMGLRFGLLFILYFVPLAQRLATAPAEIAVKTAIMDIVLYFLAFFVGIGLVYVVDLLHFRMGVYERHLQLIWPGYEDAAKMFFGVCVFAILNQLIEFRYALLVLLGKK